VTPGKEKPPAGPPGEPANSVSGPPRGADLLDEMKESIDKLARDGTSRGDLKILNRALRELRYAFKVFAPYRRQRKVSVFGSARTAENDPAYRQAVHFCRTMAENDWFVVTGASAGIMEAGHRGAGRAHSMGLNILLPFEQNANTVIEGDPKLVHMKYFFTRKLMFVKESDALVCLPGGFGTLDEALEVLTLLQTGKRDMVPVVLLDAPGGDYWQSFQQFIQTQLLDRGMISAQDRSLYKITDNCDQAVREVLSFFRVYHSMRYVKRRLALRLNRRPPGGLVDALQDQFADILAGGRFELRDALPEERDEPDLADLPRLVFQFNRRDLGRLRQLIDYVNQAGGDIAGP
jgi:uncharacterized protein (TIGR00730 family)